MKKFKVLVEVVISIEEGYEDHPLHGIQAISNAYAKMATAYGSICADSAKVVNIEKINEV